MNNSKLSSEFEMRLEEVKQGEAVRVIVMLNSEPIEGLKERSGARGQRDKVISMIREEHKENLKKIDKILSKFNGKRLSEDVDSLGTIFVISSVEGIFALCEAPYVKAIYEDQEIEAQSERY